MRTVTTIIAVVAVFQTIGDATGGTCRLLNMPVDPLAPDRVDVFVGKSKHVEVHFQNERPTANVTVFPEPPLVVTNRQKSTRCSIDGGVWVRKAVYISGDERVLVTQEFSGSNDRLNFYDTVTCKKLREIDVSNSTWSIDGSDIRVSQKVPTGQRTSRDALYRLDKTCLPRRK